MGQTAEQMAKTHQISREEQDKLAHRSHSLTAESWEAGKLSSEVMTAYAEPYKGALERDNNVVSILSLKATRNFAQYSIKSTAR